MTRGRRDGYTRRVPLDKYDLYTICVQDPPRLARFLQAVHGGGARILREDFSGPAAICRAWVELGLGDTAIAVDRDPAPLRKARGAKGLRIVQRDVMKAPHRADIIAALNFPLGYWHERRDLVRYLDASRRRLRPGGVLVADLYGGVTAFEKGVTRRRFRGPSGERITYEWEQLATDALTCRVHNQIHFTVATSRGSTDRSRKLRRAFDYDWRLWSIPELSDATFDAGFRSVDVYNRLGDAIDSDGRMYVSPVASGEELDPTWVVYVAARV